MALVTKGYIENYLDSHDEVHNMHFIGRALVVLFNRQTEDEKAVSDTNVLNGIGFTGADGHSGCITAKYYLKHKKLLDWQVERWLKKNKKGVRRISKYWRQLNEEAERKARFGKAPKPDLKAKIAIQKQMDADWMEAKDAFAQHEREMEAQAYLREEGINRDVTRRMIRRGADQRSL